MREERIFKIVCPALVCRMLQCVHVVMNAKHDCGEGYKECVAWPQYHLMRREEHYAGRRAMVMKVQGKRGRPKRRRLDRVMDDIKEMGTSERPSYTEEYSVRHRPHIKVGIR